MVTPLCFASGARYSTDTPAPPLPPARRHSAGTHSADSPYLPGAPPRAGYIVLSYFVLLNLLIAVFNSTFEKVRRLASIEHIRLYKKRGEGQSGLIILHHNHASTVGGGSFRRGLYATVLRGLLLAERWPPIIRVGRLRGPGASALLASRSKGKLSTSGSSCAW